MRKRKKDGLVSKVFEVEPSKEGKDKYIPYCAFGCHKGIILDEKVCIIRKCFHYHKLYIDKGVYPI